MPEEFVNPFFKVQVLNHSGIEKANKLAAAFHNLFAEIAGIVGYESREYPVSYREFSLAKTHLELACFYAKKAMANNPKNQQT